MPYMTRLNRPMLFVVWINQHREQIAYADELLNRCKAFTYNCGSDTGLQDPKHYKAKGRIESVSLTEQRSHLNDIPLIIFFKLRFMSLL